MASPVPGAGGADDEEGRKRVGEGKPVRVCLFVCLFFRFLPAGGCCHFILILIFSVWRCNKEISRMAGGEGLWKYSAPS